MSVLSDKWIKKMAKSKKQNSTSSSELSFQELIFELQKYWANQECVVVQP